MTPRTRNRAPEPTRSPRWGRRWVAVGVTIAATLAAAKARTNRRDTAGTAPTDPAGTLATDWRTTPASTAVKRAAQCGADALRHARRLFGRALMQARGVARRRVKARGQVHAQDRRMLDRPAEREGPVDASLPDPAQPANTPET